MDPVQYNELTKFLRDFKLPFEKQNGKQKKKFLTMARHFVSIVKNLFIGLISRIDQQ